MREAWAQIADGIALVAGAVAALCRGSEPEAPVATPPAQAHERTLSAGAPAADVTPGTTHDPIRALIDAVLAKAAATAPAESPALAPEAPAADAAADPIVPVAPAPALQPCQEAARQARERGRRDALAADPLNALEVANYYTCYLRTQPAKAEEWVRCIEAIPGSAPDRLQQAFDLGGIPAWQTYAKLVDDIRRDVAEAQKVTAQLRQAQPDLAGDWLDADREGRIWFWLGDRPDVEALAETTPETPAATPMPISFDRTVRTDDGQPLRIHPLRPAETLDVTDVEADPDVQAGRELLAAMELPGEPT